MDIATAVASVRQRIATACERVGRDPAEVRLLPVSKTMPTARIREAYAAGCRSFGENRAQELAAKADELADLDLTWTMVGPLQSNKIKLVVEHAHEFQALESLSVAEGLERRLQAAGRSMKVLVEVNSSGEPSKFGLAPAEAVGFVRSLRRFDCLAVSGLMTVALPSPDPLRVARCFEEVRAIQARLRDEESAAGGYGELSMGMTDDLELAIEHGSTVVRVGRGIFGARPSR